MKSFTTYINRNNFHCWLKIILLFTKNNYLPNITIQSMEFLYILFSIINFIFELPNENNILLEESIQFLKIY